MQVVGSLVAADSAAKRMSIVHFATNPGTAVLPM